MDTKVIDRLFEIYTTSNDIVWQSAMNSALFGKRGSNDSERMIELFTNYVNEQSRNLPGYFKSQEKSTTENSEVDNFVEVMRDISHITEMYIDDIRSEIDDTSLDFEIDDEYGNESLSIDELMRNPGIEIDETSARVFGFNTNIIKESYN